MNESNPPFDLEERTYEFALRVRRMIKRRDWDPSSWSDVQQLLRSSGSVAANYVESRDAISDDDFTYRIRISRKESRESALWLRLLHDSNSLSTDEAAEISALVSESDELRRIFSSIILRRTKR